MTDFPSGGGYDTQKLSSGDPRMTDFPSGGGITPRNCHLEIPEWQNSRQGGVKHPETVIWGRQNDRFPIWGGYDTQKLSSGDPRMTDFPSGGGVKHPETAIWGTSE